MAGIGEGLGLGSFKGLFNLNSSMIPRLSRAFPVTVVSLFPDDETALTVVLAPFSAF